MHPPPRFAAIMPTFIPVFRQQRTWRHAELLLIAAILAPGRRTITSLLRIAGLSRERRFTTYHRVLNRAAWDPRAAARLLLGLLTAVFAPRAARWCWASTIRSSDAAADASAPKASTATRSGPRRATSSRPAACAG